MTGMVCPALSMGVFHSLSMAAVISSWTCVLASTFCAWYGPNMLALTAAEISALTCPIMKMFEIAPKRGARWANTSGGSAESSVVDEIREDVAAFNMAVYG
ncbi:hypothetical protein ColKHC_02466 [Colletotrichum higginsianum]|nr:hypothetical protein ColKHC_02466 [Colletotrichum higginsianum]